MNYVGDLNVLPFLGKDENEKLTFNGNAVGGSGGADILTVARYSELPNNAADGTLVLVTEGGFEGTPVPINLEDSEEERSYIVNKRVVVNPVPKYDEAGFDALVQHCLDHPRFDTESCGQYDTYSKASGYRYCREVSKEVYEEVTGTLSEGDSLNGLYRITNEILEFEPYISLLDSYDSDQDSLNAVVVPVFTTNEPVFNGRYVNCETYVVNANATKKYALMVSLSYLSNNAYIKIDDRRFKRAAAAIYTFESGAFTFDMDGNELTLNFVKGWNLAWTIFEPSEEGHLDMSDIYCEPMQEKIIIDTKADGIAECMNAVEQSFYANLFKYDAIIYENGFYTLADGSWAFTGSMTADNAKKALALAQEVANNKQIAKLSDDDDGELLYNGKPATKPLLELLPDNTNAFAQNSNGTTWTTGDTTQYYERQEWYGDSGNVSFVPVPIANLSDGQDIGSYYTRSSRYDYYLKSNRAYNLALPTVTGADVYLHFPATNCDYEDDITLYLMTSQDVTLHWGNVAHSGSSLTLDADSIYVVRAHFNTVIGRWALGAEKLTYTVDDTNVPTEQKSLADCSWAEIAAISANGWYDENTGYWCTGDVSSPVNWFVVGDEKTITLTDGTTITVQIYGFQHDDVGTGAKAGITFGLKNALPNRAQMNLNDTNKGGWKASIMRTETLAAYYDLLPQEVKDVILPARKKTTEGYYSRDVETTYDALFLFAYSEVFKNTESVYQQEGDTYPIFTDDAQTRIKTLGEEQDASACWWWLRSPYDDYGFCCVNENGGYSSYEANGIGGVIFGFCI